MLIGLHLIIYFSQVIIDLITIFSHTKSALNVTDAISNNYNTANDFGWTAEMKNAMLIPL